jgi:hypothetical protein
VSLVSWLFLLLGFFLCIRRLHFDVLSHD